MGVGGGERCGNILYRKILWPNHMIFLLHAHEENIVKIIVHLSWTLLNTWLKTGSFKFPKSLEVGTTHPQFLPINRLEGTFPSKAQL